MSDLYGWIADIKTRHAELVSASIGRNDRASIVELMDPETSSG
jgi:hypothetical protein